MDITAIQNSIGVFSWATVGLLGVYSLLTSKPEIIEPVTTSDIYKLYESEYSLIDILDEDSIEFVRDYVGLNGVCLSGSYMLVTNEIKKLCDDISELREVIYEYYFNEHEKEIVKALSELQEVI